MIWIQTQTPQFHWNSSKWLPVTSYQHLQLGAAMFDSQSLHVDSNQFSIVACTDTRVLHRMHKISDNNIVSA